MLDLTIHFPSVVIGLILGIIATAFTFYRQDKTTQMGQLLSGVVALVYCVFWAYWHIQAAQGDWGQVSQVADGMGGIALGVMMGLDAQYIREKSASVLKGAADAIDTVKNSKK